MTSQSNKRSIKKIVIIGDGGVCKTAYAKKLLTGNFERLYSPTMGVDVHPVQYKTHTFICGIV